MNITKDQFEAYKLVQQSGQTNMFDTIAVGELAGEMTNGRVYLTREEVREIISNYDKLLLEYGDNPNEEDTQPFEGEN